MMIMQLGTALSGTVTDRKSLVYTSEATSNIFKCVTKNNVVH